MQSQPGVPPVAGDRADHRPPIGPVVVPLLTLLLALVLALMPRPAQAQTPTVTPIVFATAVSALTPEDVAPSADHVFHGDAVRISATLDGTPVPVGAAFPPSEAPLALTLRYDDPLPAEILSAERLGVYHHASGDWAPVAATRTPDESGGVFSLSVAKTGDYAVGARALRIVVQPASLSLRQGETAQFSAKVQDEEGHAVPGIAVVWHATSAAGTISSAGVFTATGAPGTYEGAVVASLGSLEGYADVTIRPWTTYLPLALRGWEMQLRPNDPLFALQWNLLRIRAPQAWASTTGGPVVVAVIDTGVDLDHPDLQASLVPGRWFASSYPDKCPAPSFLPYDDNGHGTHVAGIVGAVGDNAVGVAGTAWTARVMPIKVLDCFGNGYISDAVAAIKWAVDHTQYPARVINLSLGTKWRSDLRAFEYAIGYALDRNVLVVAASGNVPPFDPGEPAWPANFAGVMGVGSTGQTDAISGFSNQGPWVDVTAPGEGILSTCRVDLPVDPPYCYMNGTSMATPHVSGLAALLWSRYPHLSALQVANIIRSSAEDLGPVGYDQGYGWGRIDAAAALALARSPSLLAAAESSLADLQEPAARPEVTLAAATPVEYRPGYLLVRAEPDTIAQARVRTLGGLTALSSEELLPGWSLVRVPEGQEVEVAAQLSELPGVSDVSFDVVIHAMD